MLIHRAFHIIFVVCWFAGLFYLPRLFVYHADATDRISIDRFKIMERRLYYGIMWPSAVLTTAWGCWLILYNPHYYLTAGWMHVKLALVLLLWLYHLLCGYYVNVFAREKNKHNPRFYRIFNELPTLLLISVVFLVVIKPF